MLTYTPGFSDACIPVTHLPNFPKPLTDLFDADAMVFSYPELLQHCKELYNNNYRIAQNFDGGKV